MRQFVVFGRFERICEVDGEDLAEVILLEKRINEQEELRGLHTGRGAGAHGRDLSAHAQRRRPSRRTPQALPRQARRQARPAFQYAIVK